MEDLVSDTFWRGRKVFLTGHTGFKGSWLALWLTRMGAQVTGFALPAESPSLFEQARVAELVHHVEGDIRDLAAVEAAMAAARPEVVFHLAAQPLVRLSYSTPVETFATNVQGTVHVLDACRRVESLKAIVCITSDKCYENRETDRPYREDDAMGGYDPYSASKGASELVVAAYRRSFFQQGAKLASVRAGNVIGGGDWATDRLIPDLIRALIAGEKPLIRSPESIRPWQHVLEALGGISYDRRTSCPRPRLGRDGLEFRTSRRRYATRALDRSAYGKRLGGQSTGNRPKAHNHTRRSC
ncbi:CDP-glucose 4,6-dehydratase [Novosphingobium sp. G106]|uniref:CDP-glucose 4,6-dehydratase n=1 Tax=Novosphingobium sp. G106 TaxID=2849500 RepID=UPI0020C57B6E|nr:CDP-glucose 4,6-dehydratase [Novosphingobium sp. G106]